MILDQNLKSYFKFFVCENIRKMMSIIPAAEKAKVK